jgi:hypothetical protein
MPGPDCRRHPFQTGCGDGGGEVGGESTRQPGELRGLEKIQDRRIHRRAIRRRIGTHPRALHPARRTVARPTAAPCASVRITARSATAS